MKRKRTFLTKLRVNGAYYIIAALLLLVGVPLYQLFVLLPQGYADALTSAAKGSFSTYLLWIGQHPGQFLGYRALLVISFAVLLSLPFTLFRIIVAQEILGQEEEEENEAAEIQTADGMPAYAWRGKGFAVLAAWLGLLGIILYTFGTLASAIYLAIVSSAFSAHTTTPANFAAIASALSILSNTIGSGLLALSCLFFGAVIARRGLKLWPGVWVAFGYTALAVAALLSGSAVAVASAPTEGQAALTTPAILLFALWVLWFGIMLVRLKSEV
jgi:hypothetical protein